MYSVKPAKPHLLQKAEPETTEPDTFHPLAAPRNKKAQNRLFIEFSLPFLNRWQTEGLVEFKAHLESS